MRPMAGRKQLPAELVRSVTEVTRVTPKERDEFRAAAFLLNKRRADVLYDAIRGCIQTAKDTNLPRFKELLKLFRAVE